jgi:CRP-like cAMP-binding protein
VAEPGAVFGEISALLDCPHTAEVRALATSEFHVAHPAALQDPATLFYVAAILARRLDGANQAFVTLIKTNGANLGLYSYDSSAHLCKARMIPMDRPTNVRFRG